MELSEDALEAIKAASREIDYGKITISIAGEPSQIVDIVSEKRVRLHMQRAEPSYSQSKESRRLGRY